MLTDGILEQLAKYERAKVAERTHRGLLQKAREGKLRFQIQRHGGWPPHTSAGDEDRREDIQDDRERHWAEGDADPALRRSPIMDLGGQLLIVVDWHCLSPFHSGVWWQRTVATVQHRLPAIYELAGSVKAVRRIPCCMVFHS